MRMLSAFNIALEHPALSADLGVLCAAARSCKAWRDAVQQCRARNIAVVFDAAVTEQTLGSFAWWMLRNAGLVKSITATAGRLRGRGWGSRKAAVRWRLHDALQAAAERADAATPGAPAAAAAPSTSSSAGFIDSTQQQQQQQQQQQHGWRLASFSSDLPGASDLLHLLPGRSLTELDLTRRYTAACAGGAETGPWQLTQLTSLCSLQRLSLCTPYSECSLLDGCLAGIAQPSHLTSLKLSGMWCGIRQQLQELLSQPLPLHQLHVHVGNAVLSLAHLTRLTELSIQRSTTGDAALPAQLQSLNMSDCTDLAPVLALQQLQSLTICPSFLEQQQVLELTKLPALQELQLNYRGQAAAAAASTWVLLPRLRGLGVQALDIDAPSKQQTAAILAGAAAASQLTSLELVSSVAVSTQQEHNMAVCGGLVGLKVLKSLRLQGVWLVPGDVLALTALTGLTSLKLINMFWGVRSEAAISLVRSLTHLEHLNLYQCGVYLRNKALLDAVGQLKQLTYLNMEGNDGLTRRGLMRLTGLKCLQELRVSPEVADDAVNGF